MGKLRRLWKRTIVCWMTWRSRMHGDKSGVRHKTGLVVTAGIDKFTGPDKRETCKDIEHIESHRSLTTHVSGLTSSALPAVTVRAERRGIFNSACV